MVWSTGSDDNHCRGGRLMGIKKIGEDGVIATGVGITVFQLAAAKGAVKLEAKGLRSSRGSVRKAWALKLGLKASASHDEVVKAIEKRMQMLREAVEAENQEEIR